MVSHAPEKNSNLGKSHGKWAAFCVLRPTNNSVRGGLLHICIAYSCSLDDSSNYESTKFGVVDFQTWPLIGEYSFTARGALPCEYSFTAVRDATIALEPIYGSRLALYVYAYTVVIRLYQKKGGKNRRWNLTAADLAHAMMW